MNASEPREDAVAVLPPIDRDEELDRDYIPLPGGWEIQTKGKGSTFRICDAKGDRLAIPDSPYLHETLTRMAREVHAAAIAALAQQGAEPVAKDATDLEVIEHFLTIGRTMKPVGRWPGERLYAAIDRWIHTPKRDFIAPEDRSPERGHNGRGGDGHGRGRDGYGTGAPR